MAARGARIGGRRQVDRRSPVGGTTTTLALGVMDGHSGGASSFGLRRPWARWGGWGYSRRWESWRSAECGEQQRQEEQERVGFEGRWVRLFETATQRDGAAGG